MSDWVKVIGARRDKYSAFLQVNIPQSDPVSKEVEISRFDEG